MREAQELSEPTSDYYAQPLSDNLFEWHFTVRGPADSDFEGGIYHGRILLPAEYPMKPPNIIILTVGNLKKKTHWWIFIYCLLICSQMVDLRLARKFVSLFLVITLRLGNQAGR